MSNEPSKLAAWKRAELQARTVEREARSLLVKRAKGDAIDGIQRKLAEASALRGVAHRLLEEALLDARLAADALHYRNVATPTIRSVSSWHQEFVSKQARPEAADAEQSAPGTEATCPTPNARQAASRGG